MATTATNEALHELTELRRQIEECRSDLGIAGEPSGTGAKRPAGLLRRGLLSSRRSSRHARRQAPVA
ncbi:MAG: hypothetical protein ACRDKV_00110 [Solirubrobacterales bacterium]